MYIAFILQHKKSPKQLPNCLKIAETSSVQIAFNCVICHINVYAETISYCCSTWIRDQKWFIRSM